MMERLPRSPRAIAWAGVVVGLLATFVALPPISVRTAVAPAAFGLVAVAIGVWAWIAG
jgi:hypothetical protein